jgi:hypothetical protein
MGCCLSSTSGPLLSISVPIDVAAPADILWEVVTDIDHLPDIVDIVVGVERLPPIKAADKKKISNENNPNASNSIQVGTRWRETRLFGRRRKKVDLIKTIIEIISDHNDLECSKSMSVNVTFPQAKDIINTSSLIVTPMDSKHCVLIGSLSFMTGAPLFNACCLNSQRIKQHATRKFTKELQEYARAAEMRLGAGPKAHTSLSTSLESDPTTNMQLDKKQTVVSV